MEYRSDMRTCISAEMDYKLLEKAPSKSVYQDGSSQPIPVHSKIVSAPLLKTERCEVLEIQMERERYILVPGISHTTRILIHLENRVMPGKSVRKAGNRQSNATVRWNNHKNVSPTAYPGEES